MTEPVASASRTIHAPPETIWRALTTPEIIKQYMFGAEVESEWREGSPIRISGEHQGRAYHDKGEIRSFEPARKLEYTHWSDLSGAPDTPENYHVVTYELEPHGADTKVTLTQSNLNGEVSEKDETMRPEFEKTWAAVLEGLEKAVGH